MLIFSLKYGHFPDKPNLKLLRHAVANTYDEIPPPDIQRLLPVHARLLRHRFVNQQWSCRASAAFASKCVSAFTLYSVRNFVLNWHVKYLYLRQWSIINKTTKHSVTKEFWLLEGQFGNTYQKLYNSVYKVTQLFCL